MNNLIVCTMIVLLVSCKPKNNIQVNHFENKSPVAKNIDFYNQILSDFRDGSYFLCLEVKCKETQNQQIVIENNTFFNILKKNNVILTETSYQNYIINSISVNKPLILNCNLLEKLKSYKVQCRKDKKNMSSTFIKNKYFKGKIMNAKINYELEKQIILDLFKIQVFVYRDDESGYIVLKE